MSRALSSLSSSARCLSSLPTTSSSVAPRVSGRNYAQAVLQKRAQTEQFSKTSRPAFSVKPTWRHSEEVSNSGSSRNVSQRREGLDRRKHGAVKPQHTEPRRERVDYSAMKQPDPMFKEHLDGLFPGLQFPEELARRVLTHGSHPAATYGHNSSFSFLGRRVLNSYLLLLLSSSPNLRPTDDLEEIVSRTLNTYVLGEHVGSKWGLGRVMRWTPTVSTEKLDSTPDKVSLLKSAGLYKVQGDAVAAVMGGIYHQFGGSVAHRVFHTRVLPSILLGKKQDGLPAAFHEDARAICNEMGGLQGPLAVPSSTKPLPTKDGSSPNPNVEAQPL